jgi:hypothetical protein
MSADAVHTNRRGVSASTIPINNARMDLNCFSGSNMNMDAYGSQSNRPRSFSSGQGASHQSNPGYRSVPLGNSAYFTDAHNAHLQPHPYTNGRAGDGNSNLTVSTHNDICVQFHNCDNFLLLTIHYCCAWND